MCPQCTRLGIEGRVKGGVTVTVTVTMRDRVRVRVTRTVTVLVGFFPEFWLGVVSFVRRRAQITGQRACPITRYSLPS